MIERYKRIAGATEVKKSLVTKRILTKVPYKWKAPTIAID
jgi:hypothetical protein